MLVGNFGAYHEEIPFPWSVGFPFHLPHEFFVVDFSFKN